MHADSRQKSGFDSCTVLCVVYVITLVDGLTPEQSQPSKGDKTSELFVVILVKPLIEYRNSSGNFQQVL